MLDPPNYAVYYYHYRDTDGQTYFPGTAHNRSHVHDVKGSLSDMTSLKSNSFNLKETNALSI